MKRDSVAFLHHGRPDARTTVLPVEGTVEEHILYVLKQPPHKRAEYWISVDGLTVSGEQIQMLAQGFEVASDQARPRLEEAYQWGEDGTAHRGHACAQKGLSKEAAASYARTCRGPDPIHDDHPERTSKGISARGRQVPIRAAPHSGFGTRVRHRDDMGGE